MSISLGFDNKRYFFSKKSMVDKIYNEYVDKGYDVKKITLKKGDDENSAILIRGDKNEYDKDNLFQPHKLPLLNKDSFGAKVDGNAYPQLLFKNKNNNFIYGFLNLGQTITFKYKYQVIETWGGHVDHGDRTVTTTTKLTFTSWESVFPLEGNYICTFGFNSFTLPAGASSGECKSESTWYSENQPANGLHCLILAKVGDGENKTYEDVTVNNWDKKVPKEVSGTLATMTNDEGGWKDWNGPFVWYGYRWRKMWITFLDANDTTWKTIENGADAALPTGFNNWYDWPDYPSWDGIKLTFTIPGGMTIFDDQINFEKTYVYRTIKRYGVEFGGTPDDAYYKYTYYTAKGSKETENEVSFSFTYENSV